MPEYEDSEYRLSSSGAWLDKIYDEAYDSDMATKECNYPLPYGWDPYGRGYVTLK